MFYLWITSCLLFSLTGLALFFWEKVALLNRKKTNINSLSLVEKNNELSVAIDYFFIFQGKKYNKKYIRNFFIKDNNKRKQFLETTENIKKNKYMTIFFWGVLPNIVKTELDIYSKDNFAYLLMFASGIMMLVVTLIIK